MLNQKNTTPSSMMMSAERTSGHTDLLDGIQPMTGNLPVLLITNVLRGKLASPPISCRFFLQLNRAVTEKLEPRVLGEAGVGVEVATVGRVYTGMAPGSSLQAIPLRHDERMSMHGSEVTDSPKRHGEHAQSPEHP
ncbi:hypothetical protein DNTS_023920 [Danionella cerebrum]|uniref:Uncharacterized protein n=1 Tax=Danionella cerebrum TaxID=2873325 RepID=A0A553MV31_9TELE|nr:hypothetical protein DNTS_023920 [Danionella translucida]